MFALFLVCLGALSFASPSIGASSLERLLAVASKRSSQRSGSSCSPPLKPVPLDANSVDFSSVSDVLRSSFLFGGVVMGASSFGELVFNTSFGVANTNTPWTLDTISRIGSVTKVLTSVLAFQTAEMGLISLDGTKFADLFPGTLLLTPDLQPGAEKVVSVRSILGQVSGLPREPPFGVSNVSNADASVYLNATRLVLAPNERPSYSNLGFGVVGRGLERVLQQSFEDAIETQIFGPAKMKRSGSEYTTEVVQAMAASFATSVPVKPGPNLGWESPAGQVYSTVSDLLGLGNSLLTDGVLLGSALRSELVSGPIHFNTDGLSGFGTPWEVQMIPALDASGSIIPVRTKGGNVAGYSTLFVVIPEFNFTFACLWNSQVDEAKIGRKILETLIPRLFAATFAAQQYLVPAPHALASGAVGNYSTPIAPALIVRVFQANDVLSIMLNQQVFPLSYIGVSSVVGFPYPVYYFNIAWSMSLGSLDCQGTEETALNGQTVVFVQISSGKWVFEVLDYIPGIVLNQQ